MKKIIRLTESDLTRIVKKVILESNLLNEIWGKMARMATKNIARSEDDIIRAFKTEEAALAKSINDDVVAIAIRNRSIQVLEDMEAKVIHFYNPSGSAAGMEQAKRETQKFLNGYAKSQGKSGWGQIRNEVTGSAGPTYGGAAAGSSSAGSSSAGSAYAGATRNMMAGQRVSNRWHLWKPQNIDFSKFSNPMTMEQLDRQIAKALKTGDYNLIPRYGFEKFGITNFRQFIKDQIGNGARINEVIPETGRWSINFVTSF
jgi:hypothetical protein